MLKLYKYRPFTTAQRMRWLRDIIEHQRVYCPRPKELNDPYDCNIGTAEHLLGYLHDLGVFSVSAEGHDDILLFSYYADGYTGVCLEFEVDADKTIGETSFLGFAQPVQYVEAFPSFTPGTIHRLPWTKYKAWQHEAEYRVPANLTHDSSQFRGFEKEELVGIRLGLKMKVEYQRLIAEWVKQAGYPNLTLRRTKLLTDRFRFEYQRI